jgi:hypothetical protein
MQSVEEVNFLNVDLMILIEKERILPLKKSFILKIKGLLSIFGLESRSDFAYVIIGAANFISTQTKKGFIKSYF